MKLARLGLTVLALASISGCSHYQPYRNGDGIKGLHAVYGVPFYAQQERGDCGPAALASLLAQRGVTMPLATITSKVYTPALGGTLLPDMENFARDLGFVTRTGRGDLGLLRREIDMGRPVLIAVDMGFMQVSRPHYLIVFGYDKTRFLVHTGVRGKVLVDAEELSAEWEKMNSLYLYLE